MKKAFSIATIVILLAVAAVAQTTPAPSAFSGTSFSFALTPIVLPSVGTTLSGAETDTLFHFTANNSFGPSALISSSSFIGGRYERSFPSIATWLQNHTNLTGANFQAGLTVSAGVVKGTNNYWGERGGIFVHYAPAGSTSFSLGFDIEANNLPGISHWIPSIAISPSWNF